MKTFGKIFWLLVGVGVLVLFTLPIWEILRMTMGLPMVIATIGIITGGMMLTLFIPSEFGRDIVGSLTMAIALVFIIICIWVKITGSFLPVGMLINTTIVVAIWSLISILLSKTPFLKEKIMPTVTGISVVILMIIIMATIPR